MRLNNYVDSKRETVFLAGASCVIRRVLCFANEAAHYPADAKHHLTFEVKI